MRLPLPIPRGVWGVSAALGADAAWLGVRAVGYPLGARPSRRRGRVVDERGPAGGGPLPVVLLHGLVDNRSAFAVLATSLRRKGFREISTVNYPVLTQDVAAAARVLADHVAQVRAQSGADRVHVVGHSFGGIVARWYVQRMGGDAHVDTLVTLGSPHAGTRAARLLPLPVGRQLRPGSPALRALAAPAPGCRTRVVSIWSQDDPLMLPRSTARLEHPDLRTDEVRLRGVGHLALPAHPRALAAIGAALSGDPRAAQVRPQSFSRGA